MTLSMILLRQTRSAVALIFALALVPLIGLLGLAIDFGMATMAKAQLDVAADSAAMKAITAASRAYVADPQSDFIGIGQAAGLAFFQAQLGNMIFGSATAPTITITQNNGKFSATTTAQAVVPTVFGLVLGFNNINVGDVSKASLTDANYVAIQVLMDTSASMGIMTDTVNGPSTLLSLIQARAATLSLNGSDILLATSAIDSGSGKIVTIRNNTVTPTAAPSGECAFACHYDNTTSGPGGQSEDFYGVAEAGGIQLRIDVLRNAVQEMVQQVQASSNARYFQFGFYGFSNSLSTFFPMSSDLAAASAAAANINVTPLTPYCIWGGAPPLCGQSSILAGVSTEAANPGSWGFREGAVPDTKFEASAAQLIASTLTPKPTENGISASTPLRYMFIITDGVDDYTTYPRLDAGCCNQFIATFNSTNGVDGGPAAGPSVCDQIKAAGVTILVLYTTYNAVPIPSYYEQVAPIAEPAANSQVTAALQACASSAADYFQANSPSEIKAAINQMLAIASAKAGAFTQ